MQQPQLTREEQLELDKLTALRRTEGTERAYAQRFQQFEAWLKARPARDYVLPSGEIDWTALHPNIVATFLSHKQVADGVALNTLSVRPPPPSSSPLSPSLPELQVGDQRRAQGAPCAE
jgi:hypothetical protein